MFDVDRLALGKGETKQKAACLLCMRCAVCERHQQSPVDNAAACCCSNAQDRVAWRTGGALPGSRRVIVPGDVDLWPDASGYVE